MKSCFNIIAKLFLMMLVLSACEYKFISPDNGDPIDPELPISFSAEVEPIWTTQSCTGCHDGSGLFSLKAGEAYNSLTTNNLLDLDQADNSKILTVPGSSGLHADKDYVGNQRELIKVWIEQGAEDN